MKKKGFLPIFYDYQVTSWSSNDVTKYLNDLYGLIGFGHGGFGKGGKISIWPSSRLKGMWKITKGDWLGPHNFKMSQFGILALKICFAAQANPSWTDTVSKNGAYWFGNGFELAGWTFGVPETAEKAR